MKRTTEVATFPTHAQRFDLSGRTAFISPIACIISSSVIALRQAYPRERWI